MVYVPPKGGAGGLERPTQVYENSYAVVIGIDRYRNLAKLTGAVRDAQAVGKRLEERNFSVTYFLNRKATRENIARFLSVDLERRLKKDDRVLIYFAGHGYSEMVEDKPVGYIMPVNSKRDSAAYSAIAMTELQTWLSRYEAKHVLYIADACYSGLAISSRSMGLSPEWMDYLIQVTAKPVRVTLVAGRKDEEALEHQGHGLFTGFFLEALEGLADTDGNGLITTDELAAYIKPKVSSTASEYYQSSQNPQIGRRGEGEFVFLNPRGSRPQLGKILANSVPRADRFFLNGEARHLSETGWIERLEPGSYRIQAEWNGEKSRELAVIVQRNTTAHVTLTRPDPESLQRTRLQAKAFLQETGGVVPAEIWIDGKKRATGKLNEVMKPGVYEVEIRYEQNYPYRHLVLLEEGRTVEITTTFAWPPPELLVHRDRFRKNRQKRRKMAHGFLWSGLGLAVLGGVATGMAVSTGKDVKNGDDSKKDVNVFWSSAAVGGLVLGGAALVTGVVLWFLPSEKERNALPMLGLSSGAGHPIPMATVMGEW